MKKYLALVLLVGSLLALPACDALKEVTDTVLSEPSVSEIAQGLKDALIKGVTKGSGELSQKDGYLKSVYKILLPSDVRKVADRLKGVPGFSNLESELI